MEKKPARSKSSKILKLLPKAASAVTFQSPPPSPIRDKRIMNSSKLRTFISMIPIEARRKSKSGGFDIQEPTSPKVSCIGQVKNKKKIGKAIRVLHPPQESKLVSSPREVKTKWSAICKIFLGSKPGKKSDALGDKPPPPTRVPSLSQMKQFSSGRDAFSNFDWMAHGVTVAPDHQNDQEKARREGHVHEGKEKMIIPIMVGGRVAVEPRQDVECVDDDKNHCSS